MESILRKAAALFAAGGISAADAFRIAVEKDWAQEVLDLKWPWVLEALDKDPMEPDYEALGNEEPTSWYADSRESAEGPAIQ